jgi:acetoin utilization protein AcuB
MMNELTVRRFMTTGPHTIGAWRTVAFAKEAMRRHSVRHLPVVDGAGLVVGMISQPFVERAAADLLIEQVMTPTPYLTSPETSLEWLGSEMLARGVHSAIVVSHGRAIGVLTLDDMLRAAIALLANERREHGRLFRERKERAWRSM